MPPSPIQIKERLLRAIDEDSNVIDTAVVFEVIAILEKLAITKDDLEATRLGLYINNVRKKTSDQDLQKRCRKLVKSWQQLVSSTPSNNASPAPGYSPALNSTRRSPAASAYTSSPQLVNNRHSSPALQPVRGRLSSPAQGRVASPAGRLVSPLVRQPGHRNLKPTSTNSKPLSPAVSAAQLKRISPSSSRLATPNSSSTPLVAGRGSVPISPNQSARPSTPVNNQAKLQNSGAVYTNTTSLTNNNHSNTTPNLDPTNRTHAANKKRRRPSDESIASDASSIKKSRTVVNGDPKLHERTKTPRVKTTVQLIAELQAQKSTRLSASDTITKIVTNQIQKEEDDINLSVVPVGARPRFRRKNGSSGLPDPPAAPTDLSRTKSDLVHRFLQQTADLQAAEEADVDILGEDTPYSATKSAAEILPVIDMSIDPYSLLPPLDYDNIPWSDEDEEATDKVCRNAITGEYPEGYEPSDNSDDATNADHNNVQQVIEGEWDGVTGTMNVNSQFHSWTETFTISPNEKSDHVTVLPYVDI